MVKMIPDNSGRFARRPFFTEKELSGGSAVSSFKCNG